MIHDRHTHKTSAGPTGIPIYLEDGSHRHMILDTEEMTEPTKNTIEQEELPRWKIWILEKLFGRFMRW